MDANAFEFEPLDPESNSPTFDPIAIHSDPSNQEWLILNAVRQMFGIAHRGPITYAEAIAQLLSIAPLLIRNDSPLIDAFEAGVIRLYRERAAARSVIAGREITSIEVIDEEIRELNEEIRRSAIKEKQAIEFQLDKLRRIRRKLQETNWTESQVINRDAVVYERTLPISGKGQGYTEYILAQNRRLRVRVLHPDLPEIRSGADLIYETYWDKLENNTEPTLYARVAALQYKMWNGEALYTSQAVGLKQQLDKMNKVFCEEGMCTPPDVPGGDERYRLPFCCVFLRPTDRKQTRDAWQVTRAWHLPVCVARESFELTEKGYEVLRSKRVSSNVLTQDVFQNLYNRYMLGSRWIKADELKELYDRIDIFDNFERIIVHAQEYSVR